MSKLMVFGLSIVICALAGLGLGGLLPLLVATVEQTLRAKFANDASSSGLGFLIVLTLPAGLIGGGFAGFHLATRLFDSGESVAYFSHGEGLIAAPIVTIGLVSAIFLFARLTL